MRKYYFSIEENRIITIEEVKNIWEECNKSEYPNFNDYIVVCSYLQNGDLEPIENEIRRTEKRIESIEEEAKAEKEYLDYLKSICYEKA